MQAQRDNCHTQRSCVYRFDLLAPLNQDHPDPLLLLLKGCMRIAIVCVQVCKRLKAMAATKGANPKLEKTIELLQEHFESALRDNVRESRAIVFTTLRDGVNALVQALNELPGEQISARCALTCDPCLGSSMLHSMQQSIVCQQIA